MTEAPPGGSATDRAANREQPSWVRSLHWELRRGRQVVLHGEVNDRFWLGGRPVGFRELLVDYLMTTGTEVIGWWDPVDGLTFPVDGHSQLFQRAWRGHAVQDTAPDREDQDGGAPEGDLSDRDAGASVTETAQPSRRERVQAGRQRVAAAPAAAFMQLTHIHDVLSAVRQVAAQPELASAFVLQDIDAKLGPDSEGTATEYLRLRAAMNEAVVPRSRDGAAPHARNPVLVVTGDASRLPGWFCQEDPRVQVLRVARPDAGERRLWLSMLQDEFSGARNAADLEPLVGATEGFASWHLEALARTSAIRRVPVQKVTRLLDAYHFNVRGNPWTELRAGKVAGSADVLRKRVIGQDVAVNAVAQALQNAYAGVDFGSSGAGRPRGVFFFVGPTGVGKTELARAVAELIFGDENALARFDMSEYAQEHAAERLAGAPPGYVGYEQGGQLTRRVQERPFSVLLFDEIEKANKAVFDKFLQILEDGRLTDGQGETANFSQTLIIFTSNTGSDKMHELFAGAAPGAPIGYDRIDSHFQRAVESKFREDIGRPEIYGRLKPGVVVFDMLRPQHIAGITDRLIAQLTESVLERHGVTLAVDADAVHAWMEERMKDPEALTLGARQIRNELEQVRAAYVRYYVSEQPPVGTELRLTVGQAGDFAVGPARAGGA